MNYEEELVQYSNLLNNLNRIVSILSKNMSYYDQAKSQLSKKYLLDKNNSYLINRIEKASSNDLSLINNIKNKVIPAINEDIQKIKQEMMSNAAQ